MESASADQLSTGESMKIGQRVYEVKEETRGLGRCGRGSDAVSIPISQGRVTRGSRGSEDIRCFRHGIGVSCHSQRRRSKGRYVISRLCPSRVLNHPPRATRA